MARLRWWLMLLVLPVIAHEHGAGDDADAAAPADSAKDSSVKEVDAAPAEMSTPAVLEGILKAIQSELEDAEYQSVVALLAFVFGCVLVFDGEFCLRWLIACVVFVVVASMAMNQASSSWDLSDKDHALRYIVGLEAGTVGAFAAHKGMEGTRVSVGALLGVLLAWKCEDVLDEHGIHIISSHRWVELVFYSLLAIASAILLYKNKHLKMLAVISAGFGGAFCTSAIAFAATSLAAKGYLDRALPGLSPKTGSWVQFFYMLWSPKTGVRGVFVDSRYNPSAEGKEFSIDLIADYSLWFVFWLVGSLVQLRRLRPPAPPQGAEEPLLGELPK